MSNERIDEFLSWRGRLEDPDAEPGHGLDDREASWERLMDKFRAGPRRRRFRGLWVAAACVLLALVPLVHFYRRAGVVTVRPVVSKPVVMQEVASRAASQGEPRTSQGEPRTLLGGARTSQEGSRTSQGESRAPAVSQPTAASQRRSMVHMSGMSGSGVSVGSSRIKRPVVLAELPAPPAIVAIAPDTGMEKLAITPLKHKQLKVIHINELEGNAGPAPAVSATGITRHFDFFLQPSLNRAALPPPPPAADPVLLKVKLTSKN